MGASRARDPFDWKGCLGSLPRSDLERFVGGALACRAWLITFAAAQLAFSYQRIALVLARRLVTRDILMATSGISVSTLHSLMTPAWVGILGWVYFVVGLVLLVVTGIQVGWVFTAGLVTMAFVASATLPKPQKFFLRRIGRRFRTLALSASPLQAAVYDVIATEAFQVCEEADAWGLV